MVRTQLHSESIAALKGADVEEGIISDLFAKMSKFTSAIFRAVAMPAQRLVLDQADG